MNSKLNKSNKLNLGEIMMKKKILSIVMVLCLCLGFMSVSVLASELPEAGDLEVEAVAGDGEITVTWNKLEGSNISYTVYYYIDEDYEGTYKECTGEPSYEEEKFTYIISGLTNDTYYNVGVSASCPDWENDYELSGESYAMPYSADAGTPDAPQNVSAVVEDKTVAVSWSAPENDGGSKIMSYEIEYAFSDSPAGNGGGVMAVDAYETQCILEELKAGKSYIIKVCAINDVDRGEYSEEVTVTLPLPVWVYIICLCAALLIVVAIVLVCRKKKRNK